MFRQCGKTYGTIEHFLVRMKVANVLADLVCVAEHLIAKFAHQFADRMLIQMLCVVGEVHKVFVAMFADVALVAVLRRNRFGGVVLDFDFGWFSAHTASVIVGPRSKRFGFDFNDALQLVNIIRGCGIECRDIVKDAVCRINSLVVSLLLKQLEIFNLDHVQIVGILEDFPGVVHFDH